MNDVDGPDDAHLPTINLAGISNPSSYWRWYSTTSADPTTTSSRQDVQRQRRNVTTVETVSGGPDTAGGWIYHELNVATFLPDATMKLRFVAADNGPGSLVEAAVDDIAITAYSCPLLPG